MFEVIIPMQPLASWKEYILKRDRLEAGGLLLGLRRPGSLEIVTASHPLAKDKRSPTEFVRRDPGHSELAFHAWKASGGTIDWIGEWHTHPFGSANPSGIDLKNWRRLAAHTGSPMVFVIVGKSEVFYGIQHPIEVAPAKLSTVEVGLHEMVVAHS